MVCYVRWIKKSYLFKWKLYGSIELEQMVHRIAMMGPHFGYILFCTGSLGLSWVFVILGEVSDGRRVREGWEDCRRQWEGHDVDEAGLPGPVHWEEEAGLTFLYIWLKAPVLHLKLFVHGGGGLHSTDASYLLLTQQPQVRLSVFPKFCRGKISDIA